MNKRESDWTRERPDANAPGPEWHDIGPGTQGAALILELRRLQSALERNLHERPPAPRPPSPSSRRSAPVRQIEYRAPANRSVALAAGWMGDAARWLVVFGRFLLAQARPSTQDASAEGTGALGTRMDRALFGQLRSGLRVLLGAVVVLGGWATFVPLSGAIVAPGVLVVDSKVKKVQHASGGIVSQINVKDGSHVAAGDLLVRLDETQARANNQLLVKQLEQVQMRIARLVAERDGARDLTLPRSLEGRDAGDDIGELLISERGQLTARAVTRDSQKELLRSHAQQLREQIVGLDAQAKSKAEQMELISKELTGVQELYDKGLATITRLASLQREASRLDGERGQITSAIAEAKSKISETEIQLLRIDQDFRAEVTKELREAQDKEAELIERSTAANDLLRRIDVRAPAAGIVHELAVHTIGGVIAPGEMIMEIVPDSDDLVIEARLSPQDIDQVRPGQTTHVRLSAFNQRTTPQLEGVVSYVSADLIRDKGTNASYYTVKVTLPASERRRVADQKLVAGMPAEVFLQTTSRTMLSYLFKPITDQLARMFNER
jgi:HlyD family secretion protein